MLEYAAVSMRLEDYEPAIATLERMLILNPDLPRVRLAALGRTDRTREDHTSSNEIGVRLTASQVFSMAEV